MLLHKVAFVTYDKGNQYFEKYTEKTANLRCTELHY